MNVIVSFFLATFDYELSDREGNIVGDLPKLNMNALNAVKPAQRPYLRYQRREPSAWFHEYAL
jgi:sterol 14-demethylase